MTKELYHQQYEIKSWFEGVDYPNDHLMFTVFNKDGCPVDFFKVYREGNRYLVRGQWKTHSDAEEWAKQVLATYL